MENTDYRVIFDRLNISVENEQIKISNLEEYNEYAQIAELARLSEAIREPEPLSFTIG